MNIDLNVIPLSTRDTAKFLMGAMAAHFNVVLVGEPGVGKTALGKLVAKLLNAMLMITYPATDDPTDLKGFAGLDHSTRTAFFYPFAAMKQVSEFTGKLMIWMLDDFGLALPAVQGPYAHVVHAREINGLKIPDNVGFIICTNDRGHRSGVSGILEMFKGRCVILHVQADLTCWIEDFAIPAKLNPIITSFLTWSDQNAGVGRGKREEAQNLFNNFQPTADMTNSPSPRGWEGVDEIVKLNMPTHIEQAAVTGRVGKGAALQFAAWKESWSQMPSLDGILLTPDTAPIPTDMSVMHATVSALAAKATRTNFGQIIRYGIRLETEANLTPFGVLMMADCQRRDPMLITTKAGQILANSNYKIAEAFKNAAATQM